MKKKIFPKDENLTYGMLRVHPETGNRQICMRPPHFRPDHAEGNRDEGDGLGDREVEDEREILKS